MVNDKAIFDVRIVKRNISEGATSEKNYQKKLSELKDSSDNAEFFSIEEESVEEPETPEKETE